MVKLKEIGEYLAPLTSDWNDKAGEFRMSIGRVSFWIAFGISIGCYWVQHLDIPTNLRDLLIALLVFVTGTKGIQAIKDIKLGNGNGGNGESEPKPEVSK